MYQWGHDGLNCIVKTLCSMACGIGGPVLIQAVNCLKQVHLLRTLLQNLLNPCLQRIRIEDLVAAAGRSGQGIKRFGLRSASSQMELAPALEMTISAAANRCLNGASVLILYISGCTNQAFVQIALPQIWLLPGNWQEDVKDTAYGLVHCDRAKTSANNQENSLSALRCV